uniref:uncharacterized protein LOC122591584 n=1 Tax=Erigeron canadensis TaxID=72917 RepID=UPI001CB8C501|nr:uncharacterized protein LOC122591584 [Erigeron canadensis]
MISHVSKFFKNTSGLAPSLPKSTAYFCNVLNHVQLSILNVLPFVEGRLPVKYLGVPLVSTRLTYQDCIVLVERVRNRVLDWKNKFLSFAGRLQIVQSVLSSMHVYWASVFILPAKVIQKIEKIMRGFLWSQGTLQKGKAKVAWEVVCLPKTKGGLGIRRLDIFNIALMSSHIRSILTLKESLWVRWVHTYKLKGQGFWAIPLRGNLSWSWRKLLQIRPVVRPFFWFKVGNGEIANAWHDNWCDYSPLLNTVTPRIIHNAGYTCYPKFHILFLMVLGIGLLSGILFWKNAQGCLVDYSVVGVWDSIRTRDDPVRWVLCFVLYVLCKLIRMLICFSNALILIKFGRGLVCIPFSVSVWDVLIEDVILLARKKNADSLIVRLVVSASTYFICKEKNERLFATSTKKKRSAQQLIQVIVTTVRLKLMTFRFKQNSRVRHLFDIWKLPTTLVNGV